VGCSGRGGGGWSGVLEVMKDGVSVFGVSQRGWLED